MSLATMCSGDTVVVQLKSSTRGAAGGVSETYTNGATLSCNIQTVSAGESSRFQTRGMEFTHEAFFSADPSLTISHRLLWGGRKLRVLGVYSEGRPGTRLLWVAELSEETSRPN